MLGKRIKLHKYMKLMALNIVSSSELLRSNFSSIKVRIALVISYLIKFIKNCFSTGSKYVQSFIIKTLGFIQYIYYNCSFYTIIRTNQINHKTTIINILNITERFNNNWFLISRICLIQNFSAEFNIIYFDYVVFM